MRNFIKISAAIAMATSAATAAHAKDEDTGVYVSLNIGGASLNDPTVSYYDAGGTFGGTGAIDTATAKLDAKGAVAFGGAIGYDFGTIRADVEVQYSRHKIDSLTFLAINGSATTLTPADRSDACAYLEAQACEGSGNTFAIPEMRLRQLSAMGNLWLDLPVSKGVVPYVGAGLGISGVEVDGEGKGKLAWQLGAGVAINLSPSIALTADFRHRQVASTDNAFDSTSGFRTSKIKTNSFQAGFRVKL
jgi:opacity protein-like surface antigen